MGVSEPLLYRSNSIGDQTDTVKMILDEIALCFTLFGAIAIDNAGDIHFIATL